MLVRLCRPTQSVTTMANWGCMGVLSFATRSSKRMGSNARNLDLRLSTRKSIRMLKKIAPAFIITAVALISLPAAADSWDNALGGALGGIAGATVGDALGGRTGAVVGGAIGGGAGGAIAADRNERDGAIIGGALGGGAGTAAGHAMSGRNGGILGAALGGGGGAALGGNLGRNARDRDDARDRDSMRRMRRNKHRYDEAYYDY